MPPGRVNSGTVVARDRLISNYGRARFIASAKKQRRAKMHFVTHGVNFVLATMGSLVF
jgi:hypothetical protein